MQQRPVSYLEIGFKRQVKGLRAGDQVINFQPSYMKYYCLITGL